MTDTPADIARLLMRDYPPGPHLRPGVQITVFRNRDAWAIDHSTRDTSAIMGELLDYDEACEVARIIAREWCVEYVQPRSATVLPFSPPPVADPEPPADVPS